MEQGDRVKLVKGNPFGKIGIIKSVSLMTRPVNVTYDPMGLEKAKTEKYFECEAEDGITFCGWEDDLELLE